MVQENKSTLPNIGLSETAAVGFWGEERRVVICEGWNPKNNQQGENNSTTPNVDSLFQNNTYRYVHEFSSPGRTLLTDDDDDDSDYKVMDDDPRSGIKKKKKNHAHSTLYEPPVGEMAIY